MLYNNACGMRRFIRSHVKAYEDKGKSVPSKWVLLAACAWVIDRLHFKYHKGCRIDAAWKVENANPYLYPSLHGINTQADAQICSMIDRWQKSLNACHVVHHDLLLRLFGHEHNQRVNPPKALDYYQKRLHGPELEEPPIPGQSADSGDCLQDMSLGLQGKRVRRSLLLELGCPEDGRASSSGGRVVPDPVAIPKELQMLSLDELIVLHPTTKKFNRVDPQFPGALVGALAALRRF